MFPLKSSARKELKEAPVAYFSKEVNPRLAKRPLKTRVNFLSKRGHRSSPVSYLNIDSEL